MAGIDLSLMVVQDSEKASAALPILPGTVACGILTFQCSDRD
jgi:hypothetical protein